MGDKSDEIGNPLEEVSVTVDRVSSGHRHLFNMLCEEKRIETGRNPGRIFMRLVWDEAERVFGSEKAGKILNDYYHGPKR